MSVSQAISEFLDWLPNSVQTNDGIDAPTIWVGYSGGVDSHVLMHALVAQKQHLPFHVKAIHINHGLSNNADSWVTHCKAQCEALAVELSCVNVVVDTGGGESIEAQARKARYQAFEQQMRYCDILVLGHHQNDQAETVLMRLLRGGGPKGLSGMQRMRLNDKGIIGRPFLSLERADILDYAAHHHLKWIEDESNADNRFDRNFLRNEIFSRISTRWPGAVSGIARSGLLCGQLDDMNHALLKPLMQEATIPLLGKAPLPGHEFALNIDYLMTQSRDIQAEICRRFIFKRFGLVPSFNQINQIVDQVFIAGQDQQSLVVVGNKDKSVEVRKYKSLLYVIAPIPRLQPQPDIVWQGEYSIKLPAHLGHIDISPASSACEESSDTPLDITIGFRKNGDSFRPNKNSGNRPLKKCLQESDIPYWLRTVLPVIRWQNEIIYVACLGASEVYKDSPLADFKVSWTA